MVQLDEIDNFIKTEYTHFGETKRVEISRLIYEIVKRENISTAQLQQSMPSKARDYDTVKKSLIQRRFPQLHDRYKANDFYLGKIEIDPSLKADIAKYRYNPKNIYIEQEALGYKLSDRVQRLFDGAQVQVIGKYKDFIKNKPYSIQAYNERRDHLYIIKENYDFFKNCPCSPKTVSCGLHIVNMGSGCAFDCAYCYLQGFLNSPGIVLPANLDDFFTQFKQYKQDIRIGSGEYSDSLIFDHITEFSTDIVNFFRHYPKTQFEFKTKSNNIDNLLNVKACKNIVVSWSVNTQWITDSIEHFTANLDDRLKAAQLCAQAGYSVGFHFDPIFHYENSVEQYKEVVDRIFDHVKPKDIAWMSLGTLRMTSQLRKTIENRFSDNEFLDAEMIVGHDRKIRYDHRVRMNIYKVMTDKIRSYHKDAKIYLCMEEKSLCNDCQTFPFKKGNS